ncbi:hypothetical protein L6164_024019 [Bauhinia variegata]|uniref:Uncharacterized protein n=1 Tax=Bauhinia variegata TaxID=167791 RepID=A0ACB9LX74_BAUVA|nr:hypothetical protein L6164_024019 [Bauhinia variegata]
MRSLPQLMYLKIENCNELKQIIEDDEEGQILLGHVYFPKLITIEIEKCNKLRYLFSTWKSIKFPELSIPSIKEASRLEKVFRWRLDETQDKDNTVLPTLHELKLVQLPCLTTVCQGFDLETVEKHEVKGCLKLPPECQNAGEVLAHLSNLVASSLIMSLNPMNIMQIRVKRTVRNRKGEIVQRGSALAELKLFGIPIVNVVDQQKKALSETKISTEIPQKIANTDANEIVAGIVQRGIGESSIPEKAVVVTPPIDLEPQKSCTESLGFPISKAFSHAKSNFDNFMYCAWYQWNLKC